MRTLKISLLVFILSITISAQWYQTNGPYGGEIKCLTTNGTELVAGTAFRGVFLSTDFGANWQAVNNGLWYLNIHSLYFYNTNLFAGTLNALFRSSDYRHNLGILWTCRISRAMSCSYRHIFICWN